MQHNHKTLRIRGNVTLYLKTRRGGWQGRFPSSERSGDVASSRWCPSALPAHRVPATPPLPPCLLPSHPGLSPACEGQHTTPGPTSHPPIPGPSLPPVRLLRVRQHSFQAPPSTPTLGFFNGTGSTNDVHSKICATEQLPVSLI